jgi:hypothetical protein
LEEEKSYGVQTEEDEEKSWMEAGGSFYYFGARGAATRNEQARSARGWQDASSDARRFHRAALKAIRDYGVPTSIHAHAISEKAVKIARLWSPANIIKLPTFSTVGLQSPSRKSGSRCQ